MKFVRYHGDVEVDTIISKKNKVYVYLECCDVRGKPLQMCIGTHDNIVYTYHVGDGEYIHVLLWGRL